MGGGPSGLVPLCLQSMMDTIATSGRTEFSAVLRAMRSVADVSVMETTAMSGMMARSGKVAALKNLAPGTRRLFPQIPAADRALSMRLLCTGFLLACLAGGSLCL